jgi:hypothetical protein
MDIKNNFFNIFLNKKYFFKKTAIKFLTSEKMYGVWEVNEGCNGEHNENLLIWRDIFHARSDPLAFYFWFLYRTKRNACNWWGQFISLLSDIIIFMMIYFSLLSSGGCLSILINGSHATRQRYLSLESGC